ncbi:FKBP-type peptidyl-prolyl cis-trans isomerase [Mucilaginibacter sp. Bleaf8]|uniref:FKBP-type peptidyl-prolyl cis-trans isomerase n=1 Tax=Mucilaginibacter sp. Bleaf8 TaxID=2834430 RepID=UPI001BCCECEE|nr:FKBP-type peptidyl-prolyl cis-trans isomerase [Mucilaginibacter sp. Bleaf8]MBS7564298.1 FKBP-type peptidyl-prolyl cis-trans isomerase [Mucilaginibacter sp. Bleaf8]
MNFKTINLPFQMVGVNKLGILIALAALLFASCEKADTGVVINADQAAIDDKIVLDYIASQGLDSVKRVENVTSTGLPISDKDTIGVFYKVIDKGPVATLYNPNSSKVTVGYTGKVVTSGKIFAQTGDIHPSFSLGEVIKGWQLGIPKVNKGGTVRLFITSRYAYGPYAQPSLGMPANAVLDFTIKVYDVTN